jgi:hypothetical protein
VQDVSRKMVGPEDEVRRSALLEHPMAKGGGRLAFRVELPPEEKGDCVLAFQSLLNHPKSTGAAFRIEVDAGNVRKDARRRRTGSCRDLAE